MRKVIRIGSKRKSKQNLSDSSKGDVGSKTTYEDLDTFFGFIRLKRTLQVEKEWTIRFTSLVKKLFQAKEDSHHVHKSRLSWIRY